MTNNVLPHGVDVDFEIVRFVRRARSYAASHIGEIHADLDYSAFLLLFAIYDAKVGVRASELAEEMRVHKSTVSRAVSSLEAMGLVQRATHPDDARAQLLTVPDPAAKRLEEFRESGRAQLAELLSDWTPEELATFAKLLGRLNDAAEKIP
jgi:DNA-binding MarR family transcriptional regulator